MNICGIDPGLKGGIAFIDTVVCTLEVFPMPVVKYKNKTLIGAKDFAAIFEGRDVDAAYLERVWTSPQMGVVSAGAFMEGKGIILGALAASKIRTEQVPPATWQKTMRCPADAKKAVKRATELFPNATSQFYGKRGGPLDGIAEGAMIALYGCLQENAQIGKALELKNETVR